MSGTRKIPRLEKLALNALFKPKKDKSFIDRTKASVVIDNLIYDLIYDLAHPFLQCIADGDRDGAETFLKDCPALAVLTCGTATTCSDNIYENHTAIELTCALDDVDMCNMMLPYIKPLSADMIKQASDQLTKKMAEVETQRSQFKPYDFSEIVKAITADQTLANTGMPNAETEMALAKFKKDFEPAVIKFGKSFIKEHLQEGFHVYDQNRSPWNRKQLVWYLINIIGHKETRAEKCFEQACSQGLKEIVDEQKPLRRSSTIKNYINDLPLTYRGSADSSLLLGKNFFVEIYIGGASASVRLLKNYVEQQNQGWKDLSSSLESCNHLTNKY